MIHWQYIKGLNQYSQQVNDITEVHDVFTFINFQNAVMNESSSEYDFKHSPTIIISPKNQNTSDNNTTVVNFGHIITQLAENQSIDKDFIFNNHIAINAIENNQNINKLNIYQNYIYRTYLDNKYIDYIQFTTNSINVNTNNFSINADINNTKGITSHKLKLTSNDDYDGSCEAVYFNATSDRRAKTDFSLLDLNALELVKKVQLYSFKYKDSNLPSIGIIAQDVQDVNIKGFKLVDNENATGQDFDYMTIHESKLTYILWKAVQELSKEVEDLKKKIN